MNNRYLKIIVVSIFMVSLASQPVDASSGKLKGGSIINCCGQNYGHHGDGHWHKATKHDAGRYPDGANLGYSNPCSNTTEREIEPPSAPRSIDQTQQQITEVEQVQEERALKNKQAREEAVRLAVIKAAEKEKLRLEELEKERLRKIELKDTTIYSTVFCGALISGSDDSIVITKDDLHTIEVTPSNSLGTVETKPESIEEGFKKNTIIVSVTSEDKEAIEDYLYPVFFLGSAEDLLNLKMAMSYSVGDKDESKVILVDGVINLGAMSHSEIEKIVFFEIIINDYKFDLGKSSLNHRGEAKYELNFKLHGVVYTLPILIEERMNFVALGVTISGVIAGSYYIFRKKKK